MASIDFLSSSSLSATIFFSFTSNSSAPLCAQGKWEQPFRRFTVAHSDHLTQNPISSNHRAFLAVAPHLWNRDSENKIKNHPFSFFSFLSASWKPFHSRRHFLIAWSSLSTLAVQSMPDYRSPMLPMCPPQSFSTVLSAKL